MRAATVQNWGEAPTVTDIPDLSPVPQEPGFVTVTVTGAGLHPVVRARAGGKHPTARTLPHVVGFDGVGRTDDGRHVYFSTTTSGSFLEKVRVPGTDVFTIPNTNPETGSTEESELLEIAAMVNPAMSSWLAFSYRVKDLPSSGFTVLIIGATSASGRLANGIARLFGATRVIGTGRKELDPTSSLGLDEYHAVSEPYDQSQLSLKDVDVVLDYVGGGMARHVLERLQTTRPTQYVTIGSLSGADEPLPLALVRFKDLTVRGSSFGAWSVGQMKSQIPAIIEAIPKLKGQGPRVRSVPLGEIDKVWGEKTSDRIVVRPDL